MVAADVDPLAGAAIGLNAEANGVAVTVLVEDLLATAPEHAREHAPPYGPEAAEVVLAGDVFYERPMAERVMAYLERARRRGATVVVGDPGRAYLPRDRFTPLSRHRVPGTGLLEDDEVKDATVWRLP